VGGTLQGATVYSSNTDYTLALVGNRLQQDTQRPSSPHETTATAE
jgi:hypothetical protein